MFAIDSALLRPFTSAVSILGSNVLFLALLIIASKSVVDGCSTVFITHTHTHTHPLLPSLTSAWP